MHRIVSEGEFAAGKPVRQQQYDEADDGEFLIHHFRRVGALRIVDQ
ncbi:MAG: hypothetical protein KIT57_04880 [Blastocatellales bacterium]|nr:hypothetical protein [Blastocatellales bacterium]